MKSSLFTLGALAATLVAATTTASTTEETKELPDSSGATNDTHCTVFIDYGDPWPPEEPGKVVCYRKAPGSGGFGKFKPAAYAGYQKSNYGHEASYAGVCAGPTPTSAATAPEAWEAKWGFGRIYGGELFGAGAVMGAYLRAEPAAGEPGEEDSHADRMFGGASLRAAATVFGQSIELVDIGADAEAEYGEEATGRAHAYVAGLASYDVSGTVPLNLDVHDAAELFSASTTFTLGPVPVTVTGSVIGEIGLLGKTGPTVERLGTGIKVEATPYARLFAEATAEVSAGGIAGVGVTGDLTLVRAEVPSRARAIFDSSGAIRWSLDSDLELGSLDGSVVAWAKLVSKYELPIASWDGVETTIPLLHIAGCRTAFAGG